MSRIQCTLDVVCKGKGEGRNGVEGGKRHDGECGRTRKEGGW